MKTHPTKLSEVPPRYELQMKTHKGWEHGQFFMMHKEAVERSREVMLYHSGTASGFIFRLVDLRTNKVIDIEGKDD